MLKINSDASFLYQNGKVSGGYVIRDHEGCVVAANTYSGMASSPLLAESLVLRDVVIFANNLGIEKILVESDCLQLVQACRGESDLRSIRSITQDIIVLRSSFNCFGVT